MGNKSDGYSRSKGCHQTPTWKTHWATHDSWDKLNNHQRVEENKKSIAFMALTNDDEEEESESESDEDSMEEECTNEDANMWFMALEEH